MDGPAGDSAVTVGELADPGLTSGPAGSAGSPSQPAPSPPRPYRAGPLGWALRVADAGPRYLYFTALASLAVTCLLAIGIALHVRPPGARPPLQHLIVAAIAGVAVAAVLGVLPLCWPARRRGWLDRIAAPDQRAAVWLALTAWFPLLLVVVYFKAKSTLPLTGQWLSFGYLDKRWETSAYLIGALAPMLLLVAAARLLAAGRDHPRTWWSWLAGLAPGRTALPVAVPAEAPAPDPSRPSPLWRRLAGARSARLAAGLLSALVLAWYFYGPPWYGSRPGGMPILRQEDVFLTGFEAISRGATPFIGPAAVQYGPGAQLLSYLYMRHVSTFSVAGFRDSWALFEWAGAMILFAVFFLAFGYLRGLVASLLSALVYPALQLVAFAPDKSFTGFFGWADPLRYAGAIALILLLPAVVRRYPARRALAGAAVLGLLFGAMSYIAQENLAGGIVGAAAVSVLLLLTGTSSWRAVLTSLLTAAGGFAVVWVPVLAYYAVHGLLARFVHLYLLMPQAVAGGYSNTAYGSAASSAAGRAFQEQWRLLFYALPFILAVLALLMVVQFRPFRVSWQWSRERVTLVAVVITSILLYQGALLRSDAYHLSGTTLAVPGLAIMTATALPRLLGARRALTLAVTGVALFAASFLPLPHNVLAPATVAAWAKAPFLERQQAAAQPMPAAPSTLAARRVGAGLYASGPCCEASDIPMADFIAFMNQLHSVIGTRTTYVVRFTVGYPGLVYFVADLAPAPVPLDLDTMVMNVPQQRAYYAYLRQHVLPATGAVVTPSLSATAARDFRTLDPDARVISLDYQHQPVYVLLRS